MQALAAPSFESRIVPQSRPIHDASGKVIGYEHNEYLRPGERVLSALGDAAWTVFKSRYRDPLTCSELVTVLVPDGPGRERQVEMAASAVRRI
ncbi:MAG TPA: hypothetical protein VNX86_16960 [Rhizomicrobium sp.]|jgi:hypothetical protein|nr:hypothetical protein [Rhizomicrobium sp.]